MPQTHNPRKQWLAMLSVALFVVALSSVATVPFFFMGQNEDGSAAGLRMPTTHDMFLHFDQMRSFYDGLSSGEIYPRWEADTNRGFGAPTTSFYPPGVYYVTSLGYWASGDWTWALLLAQWLMAAGAGLALYVYARRAMRRGAALVAAAAYVVGPYHLLDQYQRGAIAELLGFVWMPLMLLAGERLLEKRNSEEGREGREAGGTWRRVRWVVVLGLSYGGYVWSHPPTAYQFSLGFAVAMAVLAVTRRQWRGLLWIGVGIAWGVALAAAYILPAIVEQNLIHKDYVLTSWPYHNTYVFVHDIFNARNFVDFYRRINALWTLGLAFTILCGAALLLAGNDPNKPSAMGEPRTLRRFFAFVEQDGAISAALKQRVLMWAALGLFASFMMHKISKPIGQHIPKIEIGIFTWRMLGMTTLVTALLAGACWQAASDALRRQRKKVVAGFAALSLAIVVGGAAFSLLAVCLPMKNAPVFVPETEHLNSATLPATAPGDPEEMPDDVQPAELAGENGAAAVEAWQPEHRRVRVELNEPDQLWIRAFNFPGWTATVDGKPAEIVTGEDLGDIQINLDAGAHEVRVDFLDTPIRRHAERVTLVAFALVIVMTAASLLFGRKRASAAQ
ncbi:MAG TPA: glycosyltransferase family 39 protein [Blastocatellia bacterium]|nr:glycosyltransferase family 39 protein [Blastocatellia bacterium]